MAALLLVPKTIGYNGICFTAYTLAILMWDPLTNGRAWRAHFSSDVRPFQGTFFNRKRDQTRPREIPFVAALDMHIQVAFFYKGQN